MKTTVLETYPAAFTKDFREDLLKLAAIPTPDVATIAEWLDQLQDPGDYYKNEAWIPLARRTGLSFEDLQTVIKPAIWVAATAKVTKSLPEEVVADLSEAQIVDSGSAERAFLHLKLLLEPASRFAGRLETTAPQLLLPYLERFSARCILIPRLDEQYDSKKDLDSYRPGVIALHLSVLIEISSGKESYSFLLSPKKLQEICNVVDAARIQLDTLGALTASVPVIDDRKRD